MTDTTHNPVATPRRDTLSYLRSILITNNLIYLYTAVMGSLSLSGSLFDSRGRWQHWCASTWSKLILATSRIRVTTEGLEHVGDGRPTILCVNHQSSMDIPVLLARLPFQFRFVAKRSLFNYPFMGWHMRRSGYIPVGRDKPGQTRKSVEEAAAKIRQGYPVVIFPEGGRSRDGDFLSFKPGAFHLAILAGVPITPVTLNGTMACLRPDSVHIRPGKVEMIVHPPVPTAGLSREDAAALCEQVRNQMLSRFVKIV
jgi:1-acyl-sn-glycerol-3-phosphate acyltransferase